MKKTLLTIAAALAASVISSQAQVYSQNIVGYVNKVCNSGYTPLSTPLDSGNDSATNILNNPFDSGIGNGPLDGSQLVVWNGTGYTTYLFDANPADAAALSQTFTGITDISGNFVTPPSLGNGRGYFLNFSQVAGFAPSNVVTYVGSVRGVTNNTITNTLTITSSPQFSLLGSPTAVGGGFLGTLGFTNLLAAGALDANQIQIPKVNANGVVTGWTVYLFDSSPADAAALSQPFTGVTDSNGNFVSDPQIPVGGTFLFVNQGGSPLTWKQTF